LRNLDKTFHEFKLLRINDRKKIETRLTFEFPKTLQQEQHLLFQRDLSIDDEETKEDRVKVLEITSDTAFLYECVTSSGERTRIEFVKRLSRLPVNLAEFDAYNLYCLFSPDMKEYIDVDTQKKRFVVRNTESGSTTLQIPDDWL